MKCDHIKESSFVDGFFNTSIVLCVTTSKKLFWWMDFSTQKIVFCVTTSRKLFLWMDFSTHKLYCMWPHQGNYFCGWKVVCFVYHIEIPKPSHLPPCSWKHWKALVNRCGWDDLVVFGPTIQELLNIEWFCQTNRNQFFMKIRASNEFLVPLESSHWGFIGCHFVNFRPMFQEIFKLFVNFDKLRIGMPSLVEIEDKMWKRTKKGHCLKT
jgi:hypothetical protein